jgi:hypothetical protein
MPRTPFDERGNYVMSESLSKKAEKAFPWYGQKVRQISQPPLAAAARE